MILFVPSVYSKVITAKKFSQNENIVPRKKLSEKMITLINIMKIYTLIF